MPFKGNCLFSRALCYCASQKKKINKKNRKEFTEHEGKNNFKTTKKVDARLVSSPFAAGVHNKKAKEN